MYYNADTGKPHKKLTKLLLNKTVKDVRKVNADEGFVMEFTDGTKLQVAFSGGEGDIGVNDNLI
jgi:hypothetical protein